MSEKIEKGNVWSSEKTNFQVMGSHPQMGLDSLFFSHFARFMISNWGNTTIYKRSFGANQKDGQFYCDEILKEYKQYNTKLMMDLGHQKFIIWNHGACEILAYPSSINITILSINPGDFDFVKTLTAANWKAPSKVGKVFAIANIDRELTITSLGLAGIPLEKGNYSKEVIEGYDTVISDFNSNTPAGRMAILNGEPGTGKTYLVRAMLMDVPNATFLLIPPTMIPELSGPNLISLLLENRHSFSANGPTILVLEDADYCLAPRKSDNMSAISSILNMGDGIFGGLFDIRILATTNAETKEIDPAILRPGRLSARLDVNKLNGDEGTAVIKRLLPEKKLKVNKAMTIAELYKMARDNGWTPPQLEEEEDDEYNDDDNYDD